ncbi:MAG: 3-isopropylmalate dehydrogenase [Candidatus Eisenbacteria bacterium]|uniref:3-isopropylmalate dehydrogenase n=1 Tax=Eiseniibacteriota bacterium TaxID=2212470 RepID=A0A9D6QJ49_UNCEI|nr:3-isopropylmalate dehydrogenase [Candidatus Eisenbacteria bacterium]MBI3538836.1 3-isopropylmalate dehydrogenase [Candidatus Eisenbacteria bacterium]
MPKTYAIAVIPGDGIGPEVVREGVRVLERVAAVDGFGVRLTRYPFGAEHYLATKEIFPDSAFAEVRGHDAILLGAIGDPRLQVGMLEFGIIMRMRAGLDLYVNLRPVKLYAEHLCPLKDKTPEDVDFIVVRENTEDAYTGMYGHFKKGTPDEIATQEILFTRKGTERVVRYAFDLARRRGKRKKLTLVDKANAVRAMDLWTRTFEEVGREYPDIAREHAYIDAATMWCVKNPEWFDTVVTSNMFGDILTDLAAMIQGGLGVAASGNIHPGKVSLFEPIHGSAPKYAGKNVANPIATIMAVSMMLDYLGETRAAARIEDTVAGLLRSKRIPSLGSDSGLSTSQVGDLVLGALEGVAVRS